MFDEGQATETIEAPETQVDVSSKYLPDDTPQSDESYGAMQDRMEGDTSIWQSDSDGKVYDSEGNVLFNQETGVDFSSVEEANAYMAKQEQQQPEPTAKPETVKEPVKEVPLTKTFDSYAFGENGLTPEALKEMAKVGDVFKYQNELMLPVEKPDPQQQPQQELDPIEALKQERTSWENVTIGLVNKMADALRGQVSNPEFVDEFIAPFLKEQYEIVENLYKERYEKALDEKYSKTSQSKLDEIEKRERSAKATQNLNDMAKKYYPKHGLAQFMALVNGHYSNPDGTGDFNRGEAAHFLDLLNYAANRGKTFKSDEESKSSYIDNFEYLTSNPTIANMMFDFVHYYYIGKKYNDAQAHSYKAGRKAEAQSRERAQKTVKPMPGNRGTPFVNSKDEEGLPEFLKLAMSAQG